MTKKILILFMGIITVFLLCSPAFAESFYIKNYDVNLSVDRAKQVHITEIINADFKYMSHGLIRSIPLKNSKVKNISVSEKYSVSEESNIVYIKIGDANKYVKGEHTYKISYDYNIFDKKNEFYFNIIGTDWDTEINHVNFTVKMPKEFDSGKLGLSIGKYGTKGFEGGAKYRAVDNIIEGEVTRTLQPGEGVTLRIAVPNGYFDQMKNIKQDASLVIILVLTLASLLVWFLYGKDAPVIPVVNFYPPKDMSVLDIELAYNENATKKGIIGTIINLAERGYLKIITQKDEILFKKLKDYNDSSQCESEIFKAIFCTGKDTISDKGLYKKHFGNQIESILASKNDEVDKIYEKAPQKPQMVMGYLMLFIALVMGYAYGNFDFMQIIKGLIAAGVFFLGVWLLYEFAVTSTQHKILSVLLTYALVLFPLFGISLIFFETMSFAFPVCLACYIGGIISFICFYHMKKRSKKYTLLQGELEGLKKFIKVAEVDRLKALVEENPRYFYSVLPLAYIFNLSDKWIKQFEKLTKLNIDWNSHSALEVSKFENFVKLINSASEPYYSGGGSSSGGGGYSHSSSGGGGFSGGGHGGGGGRSW